MRLPIYSHDAPDNLPDDGNRGLWYNRFFNRYDTDWKVSDTGKADWVKDNAKLTGNRDQLEQMSLRHLALITALGGRGAVFSVDWNFATGLGLAHPVENGLAWHHTLGVPYLAGSGVKGLVRAWIEVWDESLDDEIKDQLLNRWFGNQDQSGAFIFFDALPIAPVNLSADIMTPHMGKWYEKGGEIQNWQSEPEHIPADWHAPVPVPFLIAKKPKLLFGIAPRHSEYAAELNSVFDALKSALEWLGAGAKTAVGYGVMQEDLTAENRLHEAMVAIEQRRCAEIDAAQKESARQAALKTMTPIEREIAELLNARKDKSQTDITYLIGLVKNDRWYREDKLLAAQYLEREMKIQKGQWKPDSKAKKPERDREYQNTLLVMQWLG
ncbi:type III-B CRISPR module RAMP protein Cmr6 [Chromatium okenii]|jgi:CRISPR-associated protein Cmr6|uniref:type III-B CRISPR module RAMP protein Cmr6 n=1 Tax=Chromatium okenii TaxID=61644 RepID=UPI0026EC7323|nr:type III-B CRISPR module RAMP protein Cmr6 [Chromatium okenii]MBV5310964.1 type III-B CRISPR module RAMP protein Cmr6 [Chromatium okenii]